MQRAHTSMRDLSDVLAHRIERYRWMIGMIVSRHSRGVPVCIVPIVHVVSTVEVVPIVHVVGTVKVVPIMHIVSTVEVVPIVEVVAVVHVVGAVKVVSIVHIVRAVEVVPIVKVMSVAPAVVCNRPMSTLPFAAKVLRLIRVLHEVVVAIAVRVCPVMVIFDPLRKRRICPCGRSHKN